MIARWHLALAATLAAAACGHRAIPTTSAATGADVRAMTLRYHGEHHGEHTPWIFTAHVAVTAEDYDGHPAWRRSYRFEQLSPPSRPGDPAMEGSIALERTNLAPLEARSDVGPEHHRTLFYPERIEVSSEGADTRPTRTSVPVRGFVVTDAWAGLDLYVAALPLAPGFEHRIAMFYDDNEPPRPFRITVEGVETVRVPAGEFEAFRIRVDPLDGDDRMRSIYHVRTAAPRVVVRKEYVVNPRTEGALKRSTGVEELEAIELSTPVAQ